MDAIDPALRRSGRFDAEIEVTAPTENERYQILRVSYILAMPIFKVIYSVKTLRYHHFGLVYFFMLLVLNETIIP